MKRKISRRTMRRRKIMSFLRKVQCGRGRFRNFDRVTHDVKKGKYAKPQTGRGLFNNMVGNYAWGQRMKYRI